MPVVTWFLLVFMPLLGDDKKVLRLLPEKRGEWLLSYGEPLTIVASYSYGRPSFTDPKPYDWNWSISSGGQAELTTRHGFNVADWKGDKKPQTVFSQKLEFSKAQMESIRKAAVTERFFHFKESYGTLYIHAPVFRITLLAGHEAKTVEFIPTGLELRDRKAEEIKEYKRSANAVRFLLNVLEVIDPDAKIVLNRPAVEKALRFLKQ
jgi:hypothetical protein